MRQLTDEEKVVFGHNAQMDPETGRPIEQGLGSAKNPTASHLRALQLDEARKLAANGHKDSMVKVAEMLGELVQQLKDKKDAF